MMLEFSNMEDGATNLDKGRSLLKHLAEADIKNTVTLFTADGAVDGAMYLIYKSLVESGDIKQVYCDHEGNESTEESDKCDKQILTTVHLLKYIMYNCFVIGAEAVKSVNELDALWNRKESQVDDGWEL